MTLYTGDYLEYYLTLVAWVINNGVWSILVASGIFAIPFIAIIIQEWLKARGEGVDEGNKGALSAIRIENRVWVAIVVLLFAGVPMITMDLSSIKYDEGRAKQCQVSVPKPEETRWDTVFTTINNQSAKVPIWWFFVHSLSRAVTGASVASIPCGIDLRQMRMEINETRINDPVLAQEVADFTNDCYAPSRAKLFMSRPELDAKQMNDVSWIGSQYFVETPGFYDSLRSKTPRVDWPYDSTRDAGLAQVASGGGYPTCTQWWLDSSKGLRSRLIAQIDPSLISRFGHWIGFLSQDEVNDELIRVVASPRQQNMNRGAVYTDYGGQVGGSLTNGVTRWGSNLGTAVTSFGYFPAMDNLRRSLPMVLSFLKMALVICIPMLLVFGVYELKNVITVTCIQFALFFVDFWLQLARWVDSTILDALYGGESPHSNLNPLMGFDNGMSDALLNFVMGSMFLVLPAMWITALGWVGVHAGSIASNFSDGTKSSTAAGAKAGSLASKAGGEFKSGFDAGLKS